MLFLLVVTVALVMTSRTVMVRFTLPGRRRLCRRAFDDLVQLPAIQPHTPAFGTIVDLDALPIGHYQVTSLQIGHFIRNQASLPGGKKPQVQFPIFTVCARCHSLSQLMS